MVLATVTSKRNHKQEQASSSPFLPFFSFFSFHHEARRQCNLARRLRVLLVLLLLFVLLILKCEVAGAGESVEYSLSAVADMIYSLKQPSQHWGIRGT